MSGIVGIVNLDGAPVDRRLLERMTASLAFRGPDAQESWLAGCAGLGHALLRTTDDSPAERQPCSLDGQVWISADVRLDGREELRARLVSGGRQVPAEAFDAELILHGYHLWGQECLANLLGDFAFALWDSPRKLLFCARDHLGIKPFYYTLKGEVLLFSNTLNCLRLHPAVTPQLNEQAIADFLLFNFNQEPTTTTFADIQRLPAAHFLTASNGRMRVSRYWELPVEAEMRYRRHEDYVARLCELLRLAVKDRLRTERAAVMMSGGLDSSTVATVARPAGDPQTRELCLQAFTVVYDHLLPDEERHYAGLVSRALQIPHQFLAADDYGLYDRADQPELRTPEPLHDPLLAIFHDLRCQMSSVARVALSGEGPDTLLWPGMVFQDRIPARQWLCLAKYLLARRRVPYLGFRSALKRWKGTSPPGLSYPGWLNQDFARKLELPHRFRQVLARSPSPHPLRSAAYDSLRNPIWVHVLETSDPGATSHLLEFRYPFLDVRLVRYLLALPSIPWCLNKELLREAMRGALPEALLQRRKVPLRSDPLQARLRRSPGRQQFRNSFQPLPALGAYVNIRSVQEGGWGEGSGLHADLRPVSLNFWLLQQSVRGGSQ